MRERYLIFIAGMVLITILFFWWSCESVKETTAEVKRLDDKIKSTTEKLNSATLMNEQLQGFSEIIDNSLTSDDKFSIDELNNFKILIDRIRDENRLRMIKISDTNKFGEAGLIENTYNMELEGTFQQIGQFLAELERQNYIIKIQFLDISAAQVIGRETEQPKDSVNRYKMTLEMSLYKAKKEA